MSRFLTRVVLLAVVCLLSAGLSVATAQVTITGTVTAVSGGAVVANAAVRLHSSTGTPLASTTTNASGVYTFSSLAGGTYFLKVIQPTGSNLIGELYRDVPCPNGQCTATTGTGIAVSSGTVTINVALAAGGALRGKVTNASSGLGVSFASVAVYTTSGVLAGTAASAADGVYTIYGLPAGNYYLRTNASGFVAQTYASVSCPNLSCPLEAGVTTAVFTGATHIGIDFPLAIAGSITGTITNASTAAAVSGASVYAYTGSTMVGSAGSNASGVYTINGLPTGSYYVRAAAGGLIGEVYNNVVCASSSCVSSGTPVSVTAPAATASINFALAPGATVTGTVTNAATAAAVSGASVMVVGSGMTTIGSTTTNASGVYSVSSLPTGNYLVWVSPPTTTNLLAQAYSGVNCPSGNPSCISSGTQLAFTAPNTTSGINFVLQPGGAVSGTVTSAATAAGISGVGVYFYKYSGGTLLYQSSASTSAAGTYTSSGLESGTYYAWTYTGGAAGGFVEQAYNGVTCPSPSTACLLTGTPFTVTAGSTTPNINFSLRAGGWITGYVTNAATAAGVADALVYIYTMSAGTLEQVANTSTDATGNYAVSGLGSGTYYVLVMPPSASGLTDRVYGTLACPAARCDIASGTPVTVAAPSTTFNINVALPAGGAISGTVTNATTSAVVSGATVTAYVSVNGRPSYVTGVTTNASGGYTVPRLPTGQYYIRVAATGLVAQTYAAVPCPLVTDACVLGGTPVAVTAPGTRTNINVGLPPAGSIFGTVRSATGATPLSGITVYAFVRGASGGPAAVGSATSGAAGTYSITGLATDVYYLAAQASGSGYLGELYNNRTCLGCNPLYGDAVGVGIPAPTGSVDFSVSPVSSAPNDLVANAIVISGWPFSSTVNTAAATASSTDPIVTCGDKTSQRGVWYFFTPSTNLPMTFDTVGSSYDTTLSAYIGGAGNWTSIGCNDDASGTSTSRLTVPATVGQRIAVLVSAYGGTGGTLVFSARANQTFATTPAALRFAAAKAGAGGALGVTTPAQTVTVSMTGISSAWYAATSTPWLQITSGTGTGAGVFTVSVVNPSNVIGGSTSLSGTIYLYPFLGNLPTLSIPVTLTVDQTSGAALLAPFGQVDTPGQSATGIQGAIGVTGWAVDDVGIQHVRVYRNCLAFEPAANCAVVAGRTVVYVGEAVSTAGTRPDVEVAFPAYPQAYKAGWGYLLLTNMSPHVPTSQMFGGQGTIQLHVLATDMEGKQRWLGRTQSDTTATTITMANDTIAKPFGAIDTPGQGETKSGTFPNFGWALTPDSNTVGGEGGDILVPVAGTSIQVWVDGAPLGNPEAFNLCRGTTPMPTYCNDDIASIFGNPTPRPTYTIRSANPTKFRNLDAGRGAIGYRHINTTVLSNGLHTIQWSVYDSVARGEGIGSRYFTVLNAGARAGDESFVGAGRSQPKTGVPDAAVIAPDLAAQLALLRDAPAAVRGEAATVEALPRADRAVRARTGYDLDAPLADLAGDEAGGRAVRISDQGRVELVLGPVEAGYLVANGTLRDLPVGSQLDPETGAFTWTPGVGFYGTYDLVFVADGARIPVAVTVRPTEPVAPGEAEIRMALDTPQPGTMVGGAFVVAGWALDPQADLGAGIDAVHVWAQRTDIPGVAPVFLGAAALGGARPDVAAQHGPVGDRAGFALTTAAPLTAGVYDVTAYVWNRRTARWEDARTAEGIIVK